MPNLVVSNDQVSAVVEDIRDLLNSGHTLRLYQNDFTPGTPDHSFSSSDFVEATFSGYSSGDLTGDFGAAVQDSDGVYSTSSSQFQFEHDGGPGNNTIYGAYISSPTSVVPYAARFASPILMENGSLPFRLQIQVTETAEF